MASLLLVVPLTLVLMGERCGPVTSLQPALVPGSAVADDGLPGEYLALTLGEQGRPPPVKIVRDDTVDGPSYLLTIGGSKEFKDARLRLFLFDVGSARFADVVAEDLTKSGEMAKAFALPQHLLFRYVRRDGAVSLDMLQQKWVDAMKYPQLELPRAWLVKDGSLQKETDTVLTADTAGLQQILKKAAATDEAWDMALELAKKGTPAHRFRLTSNVSENSRDSSSTTWTWDVTGSRITARSEYSGRDAGMPHTRPSSGVGVVDDPAALQALVRAFEQAKVERPTRPIPPTDSRTWRICLEQAGKKPRCVERLADDEAGAEPAAARALRDWLTARVKTTTSP